MEHQKYFSHSHYNKPFHTVSNFFTPNKIKTDPFFYQTKVGSCAYVTVRNNQSRAMPFNIVNSKGRGLNHYKTIPKKLAEQKSVYTKDYLPVPDLHCGMGKKPLMPYDPQSCRSRMPINGVVIGMNNRSYFTIGDSNLINRKQWNSSYRDNYRWPRSFPISNPGINADLAKRNHKKLND